MQTLCSSILRHQPVVPLKPTEVEYIYFQLHITCMQKPQNCFNIFNIISNGVDFLVSA